MSDLDVVVYSCGLVACSACAPGGMAREEVEVAVNRAHPTGIDSDWSVSDDPTFHTGQSNPATCELDSTRKHWLLTC